METVGEHGAGGWTRRQDGRIQVSLTMPNGKRAYRMIARDKDAKRQVRRAQDALRELVRIREADLDPAGQTVTDYLRSWLRSMTSATHARVRPNTIAHYTNAVELHIIPKLGAYRLERLSERHVQAWIDGLAASPQSISHYRAALRRALNVAVRQRILSRNVAVAVDLPNIADFEGAPLTADEARRLLESSASSTLGPLWRLAVVTGLRVSELLALSRNDLDGNRLAVRAQLARVDGEWVRVPTKAARALDVISLDAATVALLDEHKKRQAEARTPDWKYWGLLFTTPTGLPLHRGTVLTAFGEACDQAGIPRRRVHDLRMTTATLLADLGVTEDVRQARLGHSTKAMARHYAKASERQDREAVERLAEAVR